MKVIRPQSTEGEYNEDQRANSVYICFLGLFFAGQSLGTELLIYPARNQSKDQMEKDKYDCYLWAKSQTGFDPMQTHTTTEQPAGCGSAVKDTNRPS